ncbi:MAG: amidohydrolase [Planctomycetaceae bacterium]|nr:amidohydrolase [Planctomycetaceae bacterium]
MPTKIIDIHNHPNWHGHNIDALIANMNKYGIEKTWLLAWEISKEEFDIAPIYHQVMDPRGLCAPLWMVVEGLHKYPDRFIGGWAPDPRDKFVRAKIKAAINLHGIKIYGELKCRLRYDNPDAIATFQYCGQLGLPVLFHLQYDRQVINAFASNIDNWPEWYGGDISVVETMCRLCPDTKFIGHGPGFWQAISVEGNDTDTYYPTGQIKVEGLLAKLMRKYDNLYCDLSAGSGCNALERDLQYAEKFITEFQNRIMFGRDYFDNRQLNVLKKLNLSENISAKILYINAENILKNKDI